MMKKIYLFLFILLCSTTFFYAFDKPEMYAEGSISVPVRINLEPDSFNQDYIYYEMAQKKSNAISNILQQKQSSYFDPGYKCDQQIMGSLGVDLSFTAMFSKLFGGFLSTGFFFPLAEQTKYSYNSENQLVSSTMEKVEAKNTIKCTNTDAWWGFKLLLAPSVRPVKTERVDLIISPGFAITSTYRDYTITKGNSFTRESSTFKETTVLTGIGINTAFNVKFNNGMFIKAGLESTIYVHHWTTRESSESYISLATFRPSYSETTNDDSSCALVNLVPSIGFGYRF